MTSVEQVFFPLDQQLELWEKHWSEGLAKEAVWLSGTVGSFEQAEEVLARIGHINMTDSTIWRRVERWGQGFEYRAKQEQQAANQLAQEGQAQKNRANGWEQAWMGPVCIFAKKAGKN